LLACGLAALSGPARAAGFDPADPWEGLNRGFFRLHEALDKTLFRPAAIAYKRIIPKPARTGLSNAISNLGEPAVAVNDLLQGHGKKAGESLTRFAGNSTFGLAGIFDVATPSGLPHHDNDFGLTLARYGVKPGPYLFVPLVGPTSVRDAVGGAAALVLNPLVYARYPGDDAVGATTVIAGGLQTRADADGDLQTLYASATDPYASIRSYYMQSREAKVSGGKLDIEALPDFDTPPTQPSAAPSPAEAQPHTPTAPQP
jgi:phospholipid-binding lipoprotein MlaA